MCIRLNGIIEQPSTNVWYMIDTERWEGLDDSEHADRKVLAIVVCPATREEARLPRRSRSRVTVTKQYLQIKPTFFVAN